MMRLLLAALAILAAGCLALWFRVSMLSASLEKTETLRLAAEERAGRNAEALDDLREETNRWRDLANATRPELAALDRRLATLTDQIANAPSDTDGPVSPLMRDTLRELRDAAASGGVSDGASGDTP